MKIVPTSCRERLEGKCRHLGNKTGRCLDDECTFLDASVWEDCCDECLDQETCDILVARCEMVKGKPCDKCHTCEDFKKNWFIRASEMKQGGRK